MRIVEVQWLDSFVLSGWHCSEAEVDISKCQTIGYVLRDEKDSLVLAQSLSDAGNIADIIAIPKVSIIDIKEIKEEVPEVFNEE